MIAALILCSYAVFLATAGPRIVKRWWPSDRVPRLTVAVVLMLACSFLIAAVTAGLCLAITLLNQLSDLSPAIDRCADQLPFADQNATSTVVGDLGLTVAVGLALRIAYCLVTTFMTTRSRRRSHTDMLRLCASPDPRLGVTVLEHADPACYCVPGRPGTIVITSGALGRLSPPQLDAVLSHERAHLRGRHHVIVAIAFAIRRSVPGIRLLSYAEQEARRLVELIADDAAARKSGAANVAAALAVLGGAQVPGVALGIGPGEGVPALARVRRLIAAKRGLSRRAAVCSGIGALMTVVVPVVLGLVSAKTIVGCPPDTDSDNAEPTTSFSAPYTTSAQTLTADVNR